ncbi:hypothetical protein C7R57_06905 [Macrococcoides caseolyticum subsp. caseolyticum]|uniref:hypothetical protein n=1 Tax=Macrococcoides caseolyticum TaxID=69966 RepID=UPI000CD1D90B|nr:hypothetical protein [Macrococcus caseolyticus]PNZ70148.1 hypothetical protein CD152_11485 [Macrococcus caseolyticus]QPT46258.1 hypothetical protein I6G25_08630 [Macrococcus caseolyticus]QQB04787.1 hypothetical protein I6H62_07115 [Macrococcus caseolyticus]RAK45609.1 hypothetical protein C7R57_06905 [Macrococcus caseolyticus subsp. caseolyticus]TDM29047.1 hypothetical protein ETH98_07410 [Macrococcus caseolyticus]
MLKTYLTLCEQSSPYAVMTLKEIVYEIQNGNLDYFEALVVRMQNGIEVYIRKYYYIERSIVYQQCLITLYETALNYKKERNDSFERYYYHMLKFALLNMMKQNKGVRDIEEISIDMVDRYNRPVAEHIIDVNALRPEVMSEYHALTDALTPVNLKLSLLESKVLGYVQEGLSIKAMALLEDESIKTIQNAIVRLKRKIRKHLLDDGDV